LFQFAHVSAGRLGIAAAGAPQADQAGSSYALSNGVNEVGSAIGIADEKGGDARQRRRGRRLRSHPQ